ncbi:MAG: hypothetical protein FOGNACKC_00843 [Anaerolineae bacterium]|nr:hypothetical protein [Anaerolineae bacterium]
MTDLPRWLAELTEEDVLEDGDVSERYLLNTFYTTDIYPDPDTEPERWLEEAIELNPEVWKAKLCRIKHDVPETNAGIAFCGLCKEYANPRKRARSAATGPVLPGFEAMGGAFQIHEACSSRALAWVRRTLYRWEKIGKVAREVLQQIPDVRQSRGWDFATRVRLIRKGERYE